MHRSSSPAPGAPPREGQGDIWGLVLAGGASRRMGTEKALLRLPGDRETLLQRAARQLEEAGARTIVVATGTAGRLGALPWPEVDDGDHRGSGPLAGLAAGLRSARRGGAAILAVLAVDLPHAHAPLLASLVAALDGDASAAAAVPLDPAGRPQPLHAAYRVEGMADVVEGHLSRGQRSVLRALATVPHLLLPEPNWAAATDWHRNVNTPADTVVGMVADRGRLGGK